MARPKSARIRKAQEKEPTVSFSHPNNKANNMALRLARKLINPTKLPRESEEMAREERWKMAPKLIEANQAAKRAKANTGPG